MRNIKLVFLTTTFLFCHFCYGQAAVSKIENSKEVYINYKISAHKSHVELRDTTCFKKKFLEIFSKYNLVDQQDKGINITLISSLHIFSFRKKVFCYVKNSPQEYKPNNLLNEFISTQVKPDDFIGLSNNKLGIYFTYNAMTKLIQIELCEIKKGRYDLIATFRVRVEK